MVQPAKTAGAGPAEWHQPRARITPAGVSASSAHAGKSVAQLIRAHNAPAAGTLSVRGKAGRVSAVGPGNTAATAGMRGRQMHLKGVQ
jgi:hypothetical protein